MARSRRATTTLLAVLAIAFSSASTAAAQRTGTPTGTAGARVPGLPTTAVVLAGQ